MNKKVVVKQSCGIAPARMERHQIIDHKMKKKYNSIS
jgi:hypothetical protein